MRWPPHALPHERRDGDAVRAHTLPAARAQTARRDAAQSGGTARRALSDDASSFAIVVQVEAIVADHVDAALVPLVQMHGELQPYPR